MFAIRVIWFLLYIVLSIWEFLKAIMDIAFKVLEPEPPVDSIVTKAAITINSRIAMAFLANSITLSKGMLFVDADMDEKVIYVQCSDKKSAEKAQLFVTRLENILKRIFE